MYTFLYRLLLYMALPIVLIRLGLRVAKNSQYFERIHQRFGWGLSKLELPKACLWIHAVSVGEVNASVPLVKSIQESHPDLPIVVTTMTPTGAERVSRSFGNAVLHCYLPYDYPGSVNRFLKTVNPKLAVVMETEIWPNYITRCYELDIPMVYTNVRLSARSYKGYHKYLGLFKPLLQKISQFSVQSQPDADRLLLLGARPESVHVTASIKFEIELPASTLEASQSIRRHVGWDRPVWVAGSTHEEEESMVLDAFLAAKNSCPDLLLVLVPRHPERFSTVYRLTNRFGCKTILRSDNQGEIEADTEVYLIDTMGELTLFIAASDFAFIGGSLVPTGGHNVLEGCAAGVAVVFGPHMFNFQEISNQVIERGAGIQILNSEELSEVVVKLVQDPVLRDQYGTQGKQFVEENRGALARIRTLIDPYLD